ncbi:MAG: hypothetical protein ABFD07_18545 [Methanobacterium sp.]
MKFKSVYGIYDALGNLMCTAKDEKSANDFSILLSVKTEIKPISCIDMNENKSSESFKKEEMSEYQKIENVANRLKEIIYEREYWKARGCAYNQDSLFCKYSINHTDGQHIINYIKCKRILDAFNTLYNVMYPFQ